MQNQTINNSINKLILGQTITVKFKFLANIIVKTGMIIKIDTHQEKLYFPDSTIPFFAIVAIYS